MTQVQPASRSAATAFYLRPFGYYGYKGFATLSLLPVEAIDLTHPQRICGV